MTVTFTPATNRYAAIVAHVAAGPSEAERAASREALLRRRRHMFTLVEQPDTPAPSVFSISAQQRAVSAPPAVTPSLPTTPPPSRTPTAAPPTPPWSNGSPRATK